MLLLVVSAAICSQVIAEPTLFMFPTNPQLHPPNLYPNMQIARGKVRDLPDSGVIYLNRIKPIADEFATVETSEADNERRSSLEKYGSSEERAPPRRFEASIQQNVEPARLETSTTTTTTVAPRPKPITPKIALKKTDELKKSHQKEMKNIITVTEEEELDRLLDELIEKKKPAPITPKIGRSGTRPKLISFDGTARVDGQFPARPSPVTVRLKQQKVFTSKRYASRDEGPDFDPWERLGS
ncbi:unnamed protein product [Caenorhabditis bovis]|uniref:Uncharacterized protein n=1 Tax=Caenorhabditis bovis TaxID=2654633 RepID=A0A8S1F8K3_9PELO|nr:unnamed protein product [Caenorhabditis bovis]